MSVVQEGALIEAAEALIVRSVGIAGGAGEEKRSFDADPK
jgi:hypothetical protein